MNEEAQDQFTSPAERLVRFADRACTPTAALLRTARIPKHDMDDYGMEASAGTLHRRMELDDL
jgi:hypothetical protein